MPRTLGAQTYGSLIVVATFIAAETGAHLLTAYPGSPLAWYVNVEVFRAFEYARVEASPLHYLFGPAALPAALAVFGLTLLAGRLKYRFGVALTANLGFVFATALAYAWLKGATTYQTASLMPAFAGDAYDVVPVALMLIASFVAFAASHLSFISAIAGQHAARGVSGAP